MSRSYWAADADSKKVAEEAWKRIDQWFQHARWSGMLGLWMATHRAVYAGWHSGGEVYQVGKDGRFRKIEANEIGNLLTHLLNMVTGQRLHFDAQAQTTDYAAQSQTVIANGLAETCIREKGLEDVRLEVAENVQTCGEGWGVATWDPDKGEDYVPGDGGMLKSGDAAFRSAHPLDVARDCYRPRADGAPWYIIREYANRYDLMAKYPNAADAIDQLPSADRQDDRARPRIVQLYQNQNRTVDPDEIVTWTLYHGKTPALPSGRQTVFLSPTIVLEDSELKYRELPVYRAAARDLPGTVFGYTLMWDLLALTQALNGSLSSLVTRMSALGVPNIWVPPGAPLSKTKLGEGLNLLEGGNAKPEVIELGDLPQSTFALIDLLRRLFSTYSGINDVARGFAEQGVKAGNALALLEARALKFVEFAQKADVSFMEQIATAGLHNYQDFSQTEHIIRITGKGKKYEARSFTAHDVDAITGYSLRIGNPLQETVAGRLQMADGLAQAGLIKKPEDYIQVLETGNLEPALESTRQSELGIVAENEMLGRGEVPEVSPFHLHPSHMKEHPSVLDNPEALKDENVVMSVMAHMEKHRTAWANLHPADLLVLGLPPFPGAPGQMVPPGAPGAPPPQGGPPPASETPPGAVPEEVGAEAGAPVIQPAQPANNPLTGQPNSAGLPM